jgi:hypothetical protein
MQSKDLCTALPLNLPGILTMNSAAVPWWKCPELVCDTPDVHGSFEFSGNSGCEFPTPLRMTVGWVDFERISLTCYADLLRHPFANLFGSQTPADILRRFLLAYGFENGGFDFSGGVRES